LGQRIKRRKDGRYEARYSVETAEGSKRRSVYGKTRDEVAVKLAKAIEGAKDETPETKPTDVTVREFFQGMHDDAVRHAVKRRTYESYRCIVNRHIIPALGNHRLSKLTTRDVQGFYGRLLASGLSPKTVTNIDTTLRRALKQAVRWGLVKTNACEGVSVPRHHAPEMTPLNRKQARTFIKAAAGDPLEALYVTAITTGLRLGELLGLRWSDMNLEGRTLTVRRALVTGYGRQTFEHPKTKRSRRTVALTKLATDALLRQREIVGDAGDDALVLTNGAGNPINPLNLRLRSFKPLLRRQSAGHTLSRPTAHDGESCPRKRRQPQGDTDDARVRFNLHHTRYLLASTRRHGRDRSQRARRRSRIASEPL
jgi:integrase